MSGSEHAESQPLLTPDQAVYHNDDTVGSVESSSRHHDVSNVTDFEQTDSWGMLHEINDNSLGKSTIWSKDDTLMDHRATRVNLGPRSQSVSMLPRPRTVPQRHYTDVQIDSGKSKLPSTSYRPSYNGRRSTVANGDVLIDVDALMKSVSQTNNADGDRTRDAASQSTGSKHSHSTTSDGEEYNSRPSSRGSSDDSSLDDVCLFLDDGDETGAKQWPDVSVLEEFSKEETERLRRQAVEDAEGFHFNYDEDDATDTESRTNDGIFFSKPIVTSIDVPELGNRKVNETEHLKDGRLRPKRLGPWHLRKAAMVGSRTANNNNNIPSVQQVRDNFLVGSNIQYPPHIVSNNPEHFRFTYFRVDLDSTVHSPTISGLLQSGQKFEDLFVSSVYSQETNTSETTRNMTPIAATKSTLSSQSNYPYRLQGSSSSAPASNLTVDDEVTPFWLDVLNPTEEEMKVLSKAFGIHPLTTEDIFLGEAREKVELFKDYYLVCFRSFDIVAEKFTRKKKQDKQNDALSSTVSEQGSNTDKTSRRHKWLPAMFRRRRRSSTHKTTSSATSNTSYRRRRNEREREEQEKYKRKSGDRHKPREGELEPLNVYLIVFRTGVLTFHFAPTPHPINVRRRARILKDYLTVTSDWIAYALIDDITDAFAPMIELIEDEVYDIEDAILKMNHNGDDSSDSDSNDSDSSDDDALFVIQKSYDHDGRYRSIAYDRYANRDAANRRKSTYSGTELSVNTSRYSSNSSRSSSTTGYSTFNANIIGWKKKGDMLRRIGECRKRVMSILRLLGSKADVIKSFAKRCNEQWEVAPRNEIGMYLGDIQDHIVTMVSSLNHYEKLLSRSHSNYLAQINIDMTKVNNDMNDVLGKITILGTVVLPMNVITGLWGMNVLVPGQNRDSLTWFMSIFSCMLLLAYTAYIYTKRKFGF